MAGISSGRRRGAAGRAAIEPGDQAVLLGLELGVVQEPGPTADVAEERAAAALALGDEAWREGLSGGVN